MGGLFQTDLAFLFEQPSIWRTLVETLIVLTPITIFVAGYAALRVGERRGVALMAWAAVYLLWMLWPGAMATEFLLPSRVISVIGWFWLVGAWGRRASWHDPLLLVANGLVVAFLLALSITVFVAGLRDLMGWDIPA